MNEQGDRPDGTENESETVIRQRIREERESLLEVLSDWLETPLLVLGFVWLVLLVIELTGDLSPGLEAIVTIIWVIFYYRLRYQAGSCSGQNRLFTS